MFVWQSLDAVFEMLKMVQGFAEGHYTAMQNFLRYQPFQQKT